MIDSEGDVDFHQSYAAEREVHFPASHPTTQVEGLRGR